MRFFLLAMTVLTLSACTNDDGNRTLIGNTFCSMRESACKDQCGKLSAQDAIQCRKSCDDNARDKCG